jgi:nucleoside-diphosphate-sugar epimerase
MPLGPTPSHKGALVIGASGFIGTRLVRHLSESGAFDVVRAADIAPPREVLPGVEYATWDVTTAPPEHLGRSIDVIFNLAAIHRTPGHAPHEYYATNVQGAENVAKLADTAGIRTILFTSSISVYGDTPEIVTETTPPRPRTDYGKSKLIAEGLFNDWLQRTDGSRLVICRPGVIFGPGEYGNYTRLAAALHGGYFVYPGSRQTIKAGGSVDELISTMMFALEFPQTSILYNFAYPEQSTISEIVRAFERSAGRRFPAPTLPLGVMMFAARIFETLDRAGIRNPVHRQRIQRLVQSTAVQPAWLIDVGYQFKTNLDEAIRHWGVESRGRFK